MSVVVAQLSRKDSAELVFRGARKHWRRIALAALAGVVLLVAASVYGDWSASEVMGAVGLWVSVAGFALSAWILLEAVGVSAASQTAVRDTVEQVLGARLNSAATELLHIAELMDTAGMRGEKVGARALMSRWAWRTAEIRNLLRARYGEGNEYEQLLEEHENVITEAKNQLYEPDSDVKAAGRTAAGAMHAVCLDLGPITGEFSPLQPLEDAHE